MPRHKQVTTCRKSGGPTSKSCSCEHCSLSVCAVCGGGEGSLTTDCPGAKIDADRQQEIYETSLDYTDTRGWHLAGPDARRSPHFERAIAAPEASRTDPRATIAPSIDWATVDRHMALQQELGKKAFAWVLADRTAEEHSSALARAEDEVRDHMASKGLVDDRANELLAALEHEKIDFHLADQNAQRCDDELHQASRMLVAALEKTPILVSLPPDDRNP